MRASANPSPACTCVAPDAGGCPCGACARDSQCTAGPNGRCADLGPDPSLRCSYDECFGDSDCSGGAPCECRSSGDSREPNVCQPRSNCRVDADCGPGGYCSPSHVGSLCSCPSESLCGDAGGSCFAGSTPVPCKCGNSCGHGYFCHTASDTCVDDSDCGTYGSCSYDTLARRWQCATCIEPP
jgi:hypothetical protein